MSIKSGNEDKKLSSKWLLHYQISSNARPDVHWMLQSGDNG
jgi:hypothetical protein